MALSLGEDYIFVPFIDVVMDKACMLCTQEKIYVVMDEVLAKDNFWRDVLTGVDRYNSITFGDRTPREVIADFCEHPEANLEEMDAMMKNISDQYKEGVRSYDLSKYKMKVQKGFLGSGGNITVKEPGKIVHKMVATKIPKPYNVQVKEYYS
jgi:hypothetical protein